MCGETPAQLLALLYGPGFRAELAVVGRMGSGAEVRGKDGGLGWPWARPEAPGLLLPPDAGPGAPEGSGSATGVARRGSTVSGNGWAQKPVPASRP